MKEKLTAEEIQHLRELAEKEREAHRTFLTNLKRTIISPELQMIMLLSSVERQREDEVIALLQSFVPEDKSHELSSAVKLFIYSDANNLPKAKAFMLENNYLGFDLEKRIINDKVPPFRHDTYPRFTEMAECYWVDQTLKACEKANKLSTELDLLSFYTKDHKLLDGGEEELMNFLFVTTGRDSVIDTLESFVLNYIGIYGSLSPLAQCLMIKSGNHKVIMEYITNSQDGLKDAKAIEELLDRANPEEVQAYFNRYAREL